MGYQCDSHNVFTYDNFFVTAAIAWFIPFGPFDVRLFSVLLATFYSLLGSYSIGRLPQLGKNLSGLQQQSTRSKPPHKVKIIVKLGISYFVPFIFLFGPSLLLRNIDIRKSVVLLALTTFFASLSFLILPISIIFGKGKQGLHDVIAGLAVCRRDDEIGSLVSIKVLLKRSFLATTIISSIATVLVVLTMAGKDLNIASLERAATEFDAMSPVTPVRCRSVESQDGFTLIHHQENKRNSLALQ